MTGTLTNLEAADQRSAHLWRASLWRQLHPVHVARVPSNVQTVSDKVRNRVEKYCEQIETSFMKGPVSGLLAQVRSESEAQTRNNKLRKIFVSAATIATSLWTQQSYLETFDLPVIESRKMVYKTSSIHMQGHPLSKVDVEDPRHDGRQIVAVIRPALLVFDEDDSSGLDGERYRVLAKAIVLLDDCN